MPDIGGVTLCGLVGVLAGCLTLLFKKPLARAFTDKNNRLNLQERVQHFESLLWRQGLALIFLGATIIVTTSV
jgi:Na+-driven multidrug efflux pump